MHRAGRSAGQLKRELDSLRDSDNFLRVKDFKPDGSELAPDNFEIALNAAIQAARGMSPSPAVYLPPGVWPMTSTVLVRGNGYSPCPRLVGCGRYETILEWPNSFTGACIDLDGSSDHFVGGGLERLSIRSPGDAGRGVGLRLSLSLFTTFRDLSISGFAYQGNDGWEQGLGVWVLGNYGAIQNNQNTLFDNVAIGSCTTGARLSACTQFNLSHVQFNQNHGFADLILEGSNDISMFGGMFQSGGDNTDLPYSIYKNHDFVSIRTMGGLTDGTHRYRAAGINAVLTAPVNGLVTVTNLAGMAPSDVGGFLYFRGNGIFEIVSYVSVTSVVILKKNGGPTTLDWEKYITDGGCSFALYGPAYHEGPIAACVKTSPPAAGTTRLALNGLTVNDAASLVDLNGTDTCTISGVTGHIDPDTFVWVKARGVRQLHVSGGPGLNSPAYDLDQFSREHATVNGSTALAGRSGLSNILLPAAAEVFDMSSINLINGAVDSVVGLNSTVASAPSASRRPLWVPGHARFNGRPAIGTRASGSRVLTGVLSIPIPAGAYPGLFLIAHLPAGYTPGGTSVRGPRVYSNGYAQMLTISVDDGVISGVGTINGYYVSGSGTSAAGTSLNSRRTLVILAQPRILNPEIASSPCQSLVINTAGSESHNVASSPLSAPLTRIDFGDAAGGADLDIAYLAVLKRPLTLEEESAAFAEAAAWVSDAVATPEAAKTGTFTVESVVSSRPVYVDISATNAVATLPTGHQAGDSVSFVLTGPANGHTLTIDPTGAAIAVNTSVKVVSNGSSWLRVLG